MNRKIYLILAVLTLLLFCWSLFGSFNIQEVIGQRCGLETVVPCIMYDVTRTVDILDTYRIYAALVTGALFAVSLVLLFRSEMNHHRKK